MAASEPEPQANPGSIKGPGLDDSHFNIMRLIYISPVPWQSYAQRSHFIVEHFLAKGGERVLWLNPYPARLPKWTDFSRRPGMFDQQTVVHPQLEVLNVPALPIEPFSGSLKIHSYFFWRKLFTKISEFSCDNECIIGVGKPCRLADYILAKIPSRMNFYDAMDDFPAFHNGISAISMAGIEKSIASQVDTLIVTTSKLAKKFANLGLKAKIIPNAFDPRHIKLKKSVSMKSTRRVGYVGTMGSWFDWSLLISLAEHVHDYTVDLYGTVLEPPPSVLPDNVHIHKPFRHDRIAEVLNCFELGLIPFKRCRLTDSVDPVKYYEYRAMGLPILSTSFGSMCERNGADGVYFIDTPEMMKSSLDRAFSCNPFIEGFDQWYVANTWKSRFNALNFFPDDNVGC